MLVTNAFLLTAPVLELVHKLAPDAVLHPEALQAAAICPDTSEKCRNRSCNERLITTCMARTEAWPGINANTDEKNVGSGCLVVRLRHVDGSIDKDNVLEQE